MEAQEQNAAVGAARFGRIGVETGVTGWDYELELGGLEVAITAAPAQLWKI